MGLALDRSIEDMQPALSSKGQGAPPAGPAQKSRSSILLGNLHSLGLMLDTASTRYLGTTKVPQWHASHLPTQKRSTASRLGVFVPL